MGTYSPSLVIDESLMKEIEAKILAPTFEGFKADGLDFRGVLFIGLMLTDVGPKVIEFNNRFGDPEAQSVLPRLKTDLLDIFLAACENRLADLDIEWREERAVTVVLSSGGYPGAYEKGKVISGLDAIGNADHSDPSDLAIVFHAGTKFGSNGEVLTAGGRVLGVTATGATHEEARARAYENAAKIRFEGAYYRKDIGIVYNTRE
jgi:phosphoribosylamine--glycine ligase